MISVDTVKYVLRIRHDDWADSPRNQDNLGTMVCFCHHHDLSDKHNFSSPSELIEFIQRADVISLPLYLYDHSILSISTDSFIGRAQHAEWDSGRVGYIYVEKAKLEPAGITDEEHALSCLESEVSAYNDYLRGSVYAFTLVKQIKCHTCGRIIEEVIDSCGGFYGDPHPSKNGMADHIALPEDIVIDQVKVEYTWDE